MRTTATDDRDVVGDILERLVAPGGYDAFATQVRGARCCRRPVRLAGRVRRSDESAGPEVVFDSAGLPDGVLLKACGTRRETLCPPCAGLYRGDAFALVAAGLRGGKGVPEVVAEHPAVLLTLTAPSFGPVHRVNDDGTCHPSGRRCPHNVALVCGRHHRDDDALVGTPLCPACYDYAGAVLFNATVSELWRRTTIYALRSLGQLAGLSVRQAAKELRLSYVKVVEFQRRGSVHLHALVRVDARENELTAPAGVDGEMLAGALLVAARKVSAPAPGSEGRLHWGRETDVRVVSDVEHGRRRAAAYLAKYSTKGSDGAGVLDHRLRLGVPADPRLPAHLRLLAVTAWQLSFEADLAPLRLRLWAHTCGFRGHFLTKSRAYSTTFGALRAERMAWRLEQLGDSAVTPDGAEAGIVREWTYEGSGYLHAGDVVLAAELEDEVRRGRLVAREDDYELGGAR